MFSRWCPHCDREMQCHNDGETLYCIGCKRPIAETPAAA